MKKMRYAALLLLAAVLAGACAKEKPITLGETAGVGRFHQSESGVPETGGASETEEPPVNTATLISWRKENGKYVYTFPNRDDSGLANVNEMNSFSRERFDDQPDDWYIGKTSRNAVTGEVTVEWDRSEATLATLEKYGAIYRGDETRKVVYLTFDAGYEYGTTSKILDVLKEKEVPATFFVNGYYVESASHLIQRMLDEGHIVGNHAVNHPDLTKVDVDTFLKEVQGLEDLYYATFPDAPPMLYFRPPSGDCNEWVLKFADMMGYTTVMWSWAYYDYDVNNQPSVSSALERVMSGLHNGCVYLLHPESQTNADMLGQMIDQIRAAGYEFLPLADIQ